MRARETCRFRGVGRRLPLCIQETQGLALNVWSEGGGTGGVGVSEVYRMPTLKWWWHSKIMKNDDEAGEGMPRAHVHS